MRRGERWRRREPKQAETMLQWLPFEPEVATYNLLDGTQKEEEEKGWVKASLAITRQKPYI